MHYTCPPANKPTVFTTKNQIPPDMLKLTAAWRRPITNLHEVSVFLIDFWPKFQQLAEKLPSKTPLRKPRKLEISRSKSVSVQHHKLEILIWQPSYHTWIVTNGFYERYTGPGWGVTITIKFDDLMYGSLHWLFDLIGIHTIDAHIEDEKYVMDAVLLQSEWPNLLTDQIAIYEKKYMWNALGGSF